MQRSRYTHIAKQVFPYSQESTTSSLPTLSLVYNSNLSLIDKPTYHWCRTILISLHVSNVHTNITNKEPESDASNEHDILDKKGKDSEKFEATSKILKSKNVATKGKANTEVDTHDGTFQKETSQGKKKSSVSKGASTSNVSTPKATGKKNSTKDDSTQHKHTNHICKKCQISFATSRILSKHVNNFHDLRRVSTDKEDVDIEVVYDDHNVPVSVHQFRTQINENICKFCYLKFLNGNMLKKHMKAHHSNDTDEDENIDCNDSYHKDSSHKGDNVDDKKKVKKRKSEPSGTEYKKVKKEVDVKDVKKVKSEVKYEIIHDC